MSSMGSLLTEVLCCSSPAEGILVGQCGSQHMNLRDTHALQPAIMYMVVISGPVPQLEMGIEIQGLLIYVPVPGQPGYRGPFSFLMTLTSGVLS